MASSLGVLPALWHYDKAIAVLVLLAELKPLLPLLLWLACLAWIRQATQRKNTEPSSNGHTGLPD